MTFLSGVIKFTEQQLRDQKKYGFSFARKKRQAKKNLKAAMRHSCERQITTLLKSMRKHINGEFDKTCKAITNGPPHYPNMICGCCTPEDIKNKPSKETQEMFDVMAENQREFMDAWVKFLNGKGSNEKATV